MARWTEEMDAWFRELSEEAPAGMKEWRLAYPRVPVREIEDALDEKLAKVQAGLHEDVALASREADFVARGRNGHLPALYPGEGRARAAGTAPDHQWPPEVV